MNLLLYDHFLNIYLLVITNLKREYKRLNHHIKNHKEQINYNNYFKFLTEDILL